MDSIGRHPACPNEHHVKDFARFYRDQRGNRPDTVKKKILRLNKAYEYWQNDPVFPHPHDYNPFNLARTKLSLDAPQVDDPPRIPIGELGGIVQDITHIRDRSVVVAQLKLGLRAGELCNIQFQDIHIENTELDRFYPELGNHWMLKGRKNAIFIPPAPNNDLPTEGRKGNKSRRPRVLPLDDELRRVLLRWLLIRPDTGDPWLFLSKNHHDRLETQGVNHIWKAAFHPEYAESQRHRGVTSHFGRHRFSTYWRVEQDLNRELVKYMRGDVTRSTALDDRSAIDDYIHSYYDDIKRPYRERIYRFNI
ncbi:tyrosine-type recombinase/integrase [Salinirubellus sp. GCM10025818]|uniref:tyrosine-type recombinase/integrase n=1 Tax=Salinirubellus TaxID=2162630 RepID=UPI0030D5DAD9